jgi:exosortase
MSEPDEQNTSAVERFRVEFLEAWESLPGKPLFFSLLAAWIVLFHFLGNSVFGYVDTPSLFGWSYYVYDTSPDDEHGKLVPFVVLALLWWKRRELIALPKRTWYPGLALFLAAILAHLLGYAVQQSRLSILAFFGGVYALMGLVWGPAWVRAVFFPMILLIFCIPLATVSESITFPLRILVTQISVAIAQFGLGIEVIREGSQIFDPQRTFQYDVAPACSGIRSLISLLALTIIYGFVSFQSGWKRLLIIASAAPIAVAGNVARITTVIIVGEAFGENAGVWVEQKFGFVTFAVAIALVFLLGHFLRESEKTPELRMEVKPA